MFTGNSNHNIPASWKLPSLSQEVMRLRTKAKRTLLDPLLAGAATVWPVRPPGLSISWLSFAQTRGSPASSKQPLRGTAVPLPALLHPVLEVQTLLIRGACFENADLRHTFSKAMEPQKRPELALHSRTRHIPPPSTIHSSTQVAEARCPRSRDKPEGLPASPGVPDGREDE